VSQLARALTKINSELRGFGKSFALVGGLAVTLRTEPRFTQDADLAVSVTTDSEAEALVGALRQVGYELKAVVEQEATGRMATVRLTGTGRFIVDLLFASSGIEPEIVAAATTLAVLPGLTMPVASVGHLIAMKLLSTDERRPNDRADLVQLAAVATKEDWTVASQSVELISQRGYSRGRDLLVGLRALHREGTSP
jgi:Nucleotidyl transferase AbiEii toxin, Type IV TA system